MLCPKGDEEELQVVASNSDKDGFGDYIDITVECSNPEGGHRFFARIRQADLMSDQ